MKAPMKVTSMLLAGAAVAAIGLAAPAQAAEPAHPAKHVTAQHAGWYPCYPYGWCYGPGLDVGLGIHL